MSGWRDINRDSWTFTRRKIVGFGGGIGEYKTSYAINQENGLILNGKISADVKISNRHLTGFGLICRADDNWNFLAFYTAPYSNEGTSTLARIGYFKHGVFYPLTVLNKDVYLDEGYNQFSLEFFSGQIRGLIKTADKTYEIIHTCPQLPFPGYIGLVKFYSTGVAVKNVLIEKINIPYEEGHREMDSFYFDVFICHSSKDKPLIKSIIEEFKKEKITYWIDEEQIEYGDSVIEKIEAGLQKSRYVVPCLSENLITSGWARNEYGPILNAEFSGKSKRTVIPLKLDNCKDDDIPILLLDKKRVTYSDRTDFNRFIKYLKS